jgi:hypothetical protein
MDPTGNTETGLETDGDVINIGDSPLDEEHFTLDPNSPNLVVDFMKHPETREALKKIVEETFEKFDSDWASCSEFRDKTAKNLALFNGFLPKKTFPFADSANAHVPILLENTLRLWSRIESEVFGDWMNICGAIGVTPLDKDEAEIVAIHSNWQFREDIPDFARQMRRAGYAFLLIGDFTVHSFWDPERRQNCHETLTPDEFVTPFAFVSTKPDYSDLPHYTKILRYYRHQMEARRDEWENVDKVLENSPMGWQDPDPTITEESADVAGIEIPTEISKDAPYVILQHEGWMTLPFQKKQNWCQLFVDYGTKRPLLLRVHEEGDWRDIERYNMQAKEMEAYRASVIQNQMAQDQVMQEGMGLVAQAAPDAPAYQAALVDKLAEGAPEVAAQLAPPLPPPQWLSDPNDLGAMPEKVRKTPIYMFTHGVCHEPMTGGLGFGPGRMLADHNRIANVALSQFADAATLNNASGMIVADGVDFDRPFAYGPGRINKAKVPAQDLHNSILPMQVGPPSQGLIEIAQLMMQTASSAAQSPGVLGGEAGKSGETYRGIATRVEQATKQISVIGRAFADSVRNVLQNNAKLNSVFLPDDQIMRIASGAMASMDSPPPRVTKEMYRRNYRIEIRSDLLFKADAERVAEADEILAMAMKIPPLAQDPPFVYAAIKASLEARHRRDLLPLLGPPPPSTGAPFNMMAPPMMGIQNVPTPPKNLPENQQGQGPPPPEQSPPQPIGPGGPRPNNPQGPGGPAPGPPPPGPNGAQQGASA